MIEWSRTQTEKGVKDGCRRYALVFVLVLGRVSPV